MTLKDKALKYHAAEPAGKIQTNLTKDLKSQEDLSLAYSPGVAYPCLEIERDPDLSYKYTGRANLVGVISNGTAVLGLGNIGALASKPVMEGKAMLFKNFANIDVFDIEINADSSDVFINTVKSLEPTFGGINLEDIKAPECFYIEETLRSIMNIPVFHDDQHGTAIISSAAFINALEITKRDITKTKVVFSGAGAAAIACAQLFLDLGVKKENLIMCDSVGVIHKGRKERMNPYKERFAVDTDKRTLAEALKDADAFVGVSTKNLLDEPMLKSMARDPIIFALANPDPEILPSLAKEYRPDAIVATGRSDFPNQVNNVLGFPFIFRGALDVQATTINDEMKKAAVVAIAELAKMDVPEEVMKVYDRAQPYKFGPEYLIPKPVDTRVLLHVAPAVAKAAMDSGVARQKIDIDKYIEQIEKILGPTRKIMRNIRNGLTHITKKTGQKPRIVIPHGTDSRMIKAAAQVLSNNDVDLILLGNPEHVIKKAMSLGISDLEKGVDIRNPQDDPLYQQFADRLFQDRQRKGVSKSVAEGYMRRPNFFASMMVKEGYADGMIGGLVEPYKESLRAPLEVIGVHDNIPLSGIKVLVYKSKMYFIADCTINLEPSSEQICQIAKSTAQFAKYLTDDPIKVALLSYSSFGSNRSALSKKVSKARTLLENSHVDFDFDGEVQADVAVNHHLQKSEYPFCNLKGSANVLIFPDLASANISYKLLSNLSEASCIGPILIGTHKAVNIIERGATTEDVIDIIYFTAAQAFRRELIKNSS